jgi:hypothetical protein
MALSPAPLTSGGFMRIQKCLCPLSGARHLLPFADYLGDRTGLYELRPGRHRVLYFFFVRSKVILLHAFLKKTDEIPKRDIEIALERKEICEVLLKYNRVDFEE